VEAVASDLHFGRQLGQSASVRQPFVHSAAPQQVVPVQPSAPPRLPTTHAFCAGQSPGDLHCAFSVSAAAFAFASSQTAFVWHDMATHPLPTILQHSVPGLMGAAPSLHSAHRSPPPPLVLVGAAEARGAAADVVALALAGADVGCAGDSWFAGHDTETRIEASTARRMIDRQRIKCA
jgi:hypothetical protein